MDLSGVQTPVSLDARIVRLLPYHFARSKGVIAAREMNGEIEVWLRPDPESSTLAEVRRMAGRPLKLVVLTAAEFAARLAAAYTSEDGATEQLIEDIGQDVNLQQLTELLPEVTDLLEAENDAPIIKLINALLTQAVREGASDIHI